MRKVTDIKKDIDVLKAKHQKLQTAFSAAIRKNDRNAKIVIGGALIALANESEQSRLVLNKVLAKARLDKPNTVFPNDIPPSFKAVAVI